MADAPPRPPAPGPLVLRGGGVVGVQTDAMSDAAHRLAALEAQSRGIETRARAVPSIAAAGSVLAPVTLEADGGRRADDAARTVAARARVTARVADDVGAGLRRAAIAYAEAEAAARAGVENTAVLVASLVSLSPQAAIVDSLLIGLAAWVGWILAPGTDARKAAAFQVWMREHPELITSPEFVALVRSAVGAVDDALLGPLAATIRPIAGARAGSGSGVELGGDAVLVAGALFGLFRESDVRVARVETTPTPPPSTIAERLRRVPEGNQVRIERYAAPGRSTRWIVYTDPTETFSPKPSREPWDLTSNIDGVAGHASGSFRATEAAMRDAGVRPGDPVAFVGYSQGALVAGMLASSGHWNAGGLETFGGPVGNIPMPSDLPGMNVRHTDDFVPALAGPDLPNDRLLVEQRAFPHEIPTYEAAPAHQRDSYDRTAAQIDAARSPEVRRQLEAMARFGSDPVARTGATAESYLYHADRTGEWRSAADEPLAPRPYGDPAVSPAPRGG